MVLGLEQVVQVTATNAAECSATSSEITMTVNALPTITLTSSDADNTIDEGTSVTFTAMGGTLYEFFINNNSVRTNNNQNTYTTTDLIDEDEVSVKGTNADGCTAVSSVITMMVNTVNTSAEAGANQLNICGTMAQLAAIEPMIGTGQWTASPVGGSFVDDTKANTQFQGQAGVTYTLIWTVIGASDQVQISFNGDSDNDTVQDCIDRCPGGDDRINTDGVGMPDACDCNPNDPNDETIELPGDIITDPVLTSGLYQSSVAIMSTAQINTGRDVVFKAGEQISLQPGFHAQAGSAFSAQIEPCTSGNTLVDAETATFRNLIQAALAEKVKQPNPTGAESTNTILTGKMTADISMTVGPNPFMDRTTAFIDLPQATTASLMVFDVQGQLVQMVLQNADMQVGKYALPINMTAFTSGIFYIHLRTSEGSMVKKVLSIR